MKISTLHQARLCAVEWNWKCPIFPRVRCLALLFWIGNGAVQTIMLLWFEAKQDVLKQVEWWMRPFQVKIWKMRVLKFCTRILTTKVFQLLLVWQLAKAVWTVLLSSIAGGALLVGLLVAAKLKPSSTTDFRSSSGSLMASSSSSRSDSSFTNKWCRVQTDRQVRFRNLVRCVASRLKKYSSKTFSIRNNRGKTKWSLISCLPKDAQGFKIWKPLRWWEEPPSKFRAQQEIQEKRDTSWFLLKPKGCISSKGSPSLAHMYGLQDRIGLKSGDLFKVQAKISQVRYLSGKSESGTPRANHRFQLCTVQSTS